MAIKRSFSGIDNLRFKTAIMEHTDASTPYTAYDAKLLSLEGTYFSCIANPLSGIGLQTVSDMSFLASCPTSCDSIDYSAVDNDARTKFYDKMTSSFNSGTFIGELGETMRMLHSPAKALRARLDADHIKAYTLRSSVIAEARLEKERLLRHVTSVTLANRAARRAAIDAQVKRNAERKWSKVAAELALEYNFGWTPLANDIQSAFERLTELLEEPGIERFIARCQATSIIPNEYAGSNGHIRWSATRFKSENRVIQVQYKGAVSATKHHDLNLSQKFAIEPGDLVMAGWELLPYSFLIDYFANVGKVLNAVILYQRIKYIYCCRTVRITNRVLLSQVTKPFTDDKVMVNLPGKARVVLKKVVRTPLLNVPIPALTFTFAQSTRHLFNMAALWHARDADANFRSKLRL